MHKFYTFEDSLKDQLKNPEFRKIWEHSESNRQIGSFLIGKMIKHKLSRAQLAKKIGISKSTVYKLVETNYDPSFNLLRRIASAFNSRLKIAFASHVLEVRLSGSFNQILIPLLAAFREGSTGIYTGRR